MIVKEYYGVDEIEVSMKSNKVDIDLTNAGMLYGVSLDKESALKLGNEIIRLANEL